MSQPHDDIRALRLMVDELRAEPPPDLPWDTIEKRLMDRLAPETPGSRSEVRSLGVRRGREGYGSPLSRVIGFAAAAAAIVFGVSSMTSSDLPAASAPERHVIDASAVAAAPQVEHAHDLSALRPGDVVEAAEAPVTFAQAGLVTWTLAPGSAVRVRSTGLGHTLALERGSLRAEVTPRDPSEGLVEAFAVEAYGTRVAVHGTAFTVSLVDGRVIVDVEHGAVAVGPIGYAGATTGHLLVGPSRASFSLDGGRTAQLLARTPEPVAAADVPPPAVGRTAATRPSPGPVEPAPITTPVPHTGLLAHAHARPAAERPSVAPVPAAEPARLTADVIHARLERCFKQLQTSRDGDSSVHIDPISTTFHITILADRTGTGRWTSPVKPEISVCAGSALVGRFPDGIDHMDVPVTFQP